MQKQIKQQIIWLLEKSSQEGTSSDEQFAFMANIMAIMAEQISTSINSIDILGSNDTELDAIIKLAQTGTYMSESIDAIIKRLPPIAGYNWDNIRCELGNLDDKLNQLYSGLMDIASKGEDMPDKSHIDCVRREISESRNACRVLLDTFNTMNERLAKVRHRVLMEWSDEISSWQSQCVSRLEAALSVVDSQESILSSLEEYKKMGIVIKKKLSSLTQEDGE